MFDNFNSLITIQSDCSLLGRENASSTLGVGLTVAVGGRALIG